MDELEERAKELIDEFVQNHHFQNAAAFSLYCGSIKEIHIQEGCQDCLSGVNIEDGVIEESGTSKVNIPSYTGNTRENDAILRDRKSRKSVCVQKLEYSSSESDLDDTDDSVDENVAEHDDTMDEVFVEHGSIRKLADSPPTSDHKNLFSDIVDEKESFFPDHNTPSPKENSSPTDAKLLDDSMDYSPVIRKKKNCARILSDSDEVGDEDEKIDKHVEIISASSSSTDKGDDTDDDNSSVSDVSDIANIVNKLNISSNDDSNGSDFEQDEKSSKKKHCNKKITNFMTPKSHVRSVDDSSDSDSPSDKKKHWLNKKAVMTPKSSVRGIVDSFPTTSSVPGTPGYKRHFNSKREGIVRELFSLYNKTVFENRLPQDLSITWNKRLTKTAGYCYLLREAGNRNSRIELSDKVIDSVERIRDTLIHELCHAAVWLFEGKRGHGREWKYWAKKANKIHSDLPVITTCHTYDIQTKYKYQCDGCGTVFGRHTKSIDASKQRCGNCGGRPLLLSSSSETPKQISTYASYVKENFSSVKKCNPALSSKELMKKIAEDYRANKDLSNKENIGSIS